MKSDMLLDTMSTCFLCLKEIDKDAEFDSVKLFSVTMLSRYLKINLEKIPGVLKPPDNFEGEQLVPTCSICFQILTTFGKRYQELQLAKMKIQASLQKILEMIKDPKVHVDAQGTRTHMQFVTNFRQVINSRSTAKLKRMQPKVQLEKLDLGMETKIPKRPYQGSIEVDLTSPVVVLSSSNETMTKAENVSPVELIELADDDNFMLMLESSGNNESQETELAIPKSPLTPELDQGFIVCKYCNSPLKSRATLKTHLNTIHFEKQFLSFKLPSLSQEQFQLATRNYLENLINVQIKPNDLTENRRRCPYCPQLLCGNDINQFKRSLQIHLICQHFSIVAQNIISFQTEFSDHSKSGNFGPFINAQRISAEANAIMKELISTSPSTILVACQYCDDHFTGAFIQRHIDDVHFEERFASSKLPSLSNEQFKLAIQCYLESISSGDDEANLNTDKEPGNQCPYCFKILEKEQLKQSLKFHLISRHFSLVSREILPFQKQFEVETRGESSTAVVETATVAETTDPPLVKMEIPDNHEESLASIQVPSAELLSLLDEDYESQEVKVDTMVMVAGLNIVGEEICQYCQLEFSSNYMESHINHVHIEERFASMKLPFFSKEQFKLTCQQGLDEIINASSKESSKFQCPHCPKKFAGSNTNSKESLRNHLIAQHFSEVSQAIVKFQEQLASTSPTPESFNETGEFTADGKKIYVCGLCAKRVTNINFHIRNHGKDRLRCEHCPMTFIQAIKRDLHVSMSHCDILYARLNTASLAKDELNSVIDMAFEEILNFKGDPSKTNRCPQCPDYHPKEKHSTERHWRRHMTNLHFDFVGNKIYNLQLKYPTNSLGQVHKCICGKRFSRTGSFNRHKRYSCAVLRSPVIHKQNKRFYCDCGLNYSRPDKVWQHRKSRFCPLHDNKESVVAVTGTPSSTSPVVAGTSYPQRLTNLNRGNGTSHTVLPKPKQTYYCKCGSSFTQSSSLYRHRRNRVCRFSFREKSSNIKSRVCESHGKKESVVAVTGTPSSTSPVVGGTSYPQRLTNLNRGNGTSHAVMPKTKQTYYCKCGSSFTQSSSLYRHRRNRVCRFSFQEKSSMSGTELTSTSSSSTAAVESPGIPIETPTAYEDHPLNHQNETMERILEIPMDIEPNDEVFIIENNDLKMYFSEDEQNKDHGEEEVILGDPLAFI